MKNTTHRVVILKNVNSALISQAILILKDTAGESDTNVMLEAERIVEKYMGTKTMVKPVARNNTRLAAGIVSAGVILLGVGIFIVSRFV
ncbi:MAG: hypothetical protein J6C82_02850 [Clostridia bacterium]|nr:hypothetical protein [Clostridia bacterium]